MAIHTTQQKLQHYYAWERARTITSCNQLRAMQNATGVGINLIEAHFLSRLKKWYEEFKTREEKEIMNFLSPRGYMQPSSHSPKRKAFNRSRKLTQ